MKKKHEELQNEAVDKKKKKKLLGKQKGPSACMGFIDWPTQAVT